MQKEIDFMQVEVEKMRKEYSVKIDQLKLEKEQAEAKSVKLKATLEKIKNAPKPVKIDLVDTNSS